MKHKRKIDNRLVSIEKLCAMLVCSGQPLKNEEATELYEARAASKFTYDPINEILKDKVKL